MHADDADNTDTTSSDKWMGELTPSDGPKASEAGAAPAEVDVPPQEKPAVQPPSVMAYKRGFERGSQHRGMALQWSLGGLVILALAFGGGWLGAAAHEESPATNVTRQTVQLKGEAAVISNIANTVGQSVVSVNVTSQQASSNPYAGFFGFSGGTTTQQSAGTGIILTANGLIMTNRHVVPSGTTSVSVTLSDGTVYDNVKVVGRTSDRDSLDVAFLQIPDTQGKSLVPVELGDSSKVNVGDPVVAIGNALGQFQNTVTSGIISGYGRSLQASASDGSSTENLDNLFQTDAAINEGNSGGPLVNLDGQVIGMNTAVASSGQGIGFAIPINDLSGLIKSVKDTGKLQKPYLGVIYVPITKDVAKQYNLSATQGAYVPSSKDADGTATVISGSPADKAGIKPGDIITKIDGTNIDESHSLTALLGTHKVGDRVDLTIMRGDQMLTKSVTLGTAPSD